MNDGETFLRRSVKLKAASDAFFRRFPSQKDEGVLCQILKSSEGYSKRRNEPLYLVQFEIK
jgi:hypothetical protein